MDLEGLKRRLATASPVRAEGRVVAVTGTSLTVQVPGARIADLVVVRRRGAPLLAEIVGFRGGEVTAMPLGTLDGVGPDDPVETTGGPLEIRVGEGLLGRVLDGLGRPIDAGPPLEGPQVGVDRPPPLPLERRHVGEPLVTGIRAIDGLLTLGVGQRVGLFSGSGVGKSTLLGALARGAEADVVVVALVGERGREVRDMLDVTLAPARARAVVVVATSDAPAVERLRAAQVATRVAESFRDSGKRVLLLVDSITRVARAQREVGLSAGEPPARRGYPPSVFAMLPRLLERSGQGARGSVTAVYAVLVEGDDLDEPVTDEVRGILDGHIVLSRSVAQRGRYPAIDVTASISRVMPRVASADHQKAAARTRALLSTYEEKRDLVILGAYRAGADALLDRAVRAEPDITRFLHQDADESLPLERTIDLLSQIVARHAG